MFVAPTNCRQLPLHRFRTSASSSSMLFQQSKYQIITHRSPHTSSQVVLIDFSAVFLSVSSFFTKLCVLHIRQQASLAPLSRYGSTCFPTKSLLQAGSLLLELFHFRGPHLLPSELFTREYPKTGTQLTRPSARQLKRGTESFNLLLLLFSRLHSTFVAVSSNFFLPVLQRSRKTKTQRSLPLGVSATLVFKKRVRATS
uniref:(northern house mosquito) hypothetical protein n=1 Tax=Culex pipiens TaxID=7175 RepID=A0A8D8BV92_CULPI